MHNKIRYACIPTKCLKWLKKTFLLIFDEISFRFQLGRALHSLPEAHNQPEERVGGAGELDQTIYAGAERILLEIHHQRCQLFGDRQQRSALLRFCSFSKFFIAEIWSILWIVQRLLQMDVTDRGRCAQIRGFLLSRIHVAAGPSQRLGSFWFSKKFFKWRRIY